MVTNNIHIAYMLLVHKGPEQVNLFIEQILKDNDSDIYIHVDKKNYSAVASKLLKNPRVIVLRESISGAWGDISLVDATILLINAVLNSDKSYDFLCLRSGQDLLIKDNYKEYLSSNKEHNFMTAYIMSKSSDYYSCINVSWPKCTRRLYDNMHPFRILRSLLKKMYGIGINILPNRNVLPEGFDLYDGSQWFTITADFAKYIVNFLDKNPWYYRAFENALVPDTYFFQTLIKNSPYSDTVININHVYTKWGENLKSVNHPTTLTKENINTIEETDNYFARKFDCNTDCEVIKYFYNKILR